MRRVVIAGLVGLATTLALAGGLEDAERLLSEGKLDEAAEAFEQAEEAGADPGACALGLAIVHNRQGDARKAAKEAERAVEALSDPVEKAKAYNQLGIAEASRGRSKKLLASAREAFERALELSGGDFNVVRYSLARVMIQQGEVDAALPVLEEFLETADGDMAHHAQMILEHPDRADDAYSPNFQIETTDGEIIKSADLRGKVVLLDFWATWCGPCRDALPHLKKLSKRATDEPLVVIGVSTDENQSLLEKFVDENGMTWAQHWDPKGKLAGQTFRIDGLPTYVVIDHEGFIVHRSLGWSPKTRRALDRDLAKALEEVPQPRSGT